MRVTVCLLLSAVLLAAVAAEASEAGSGYADLEGNVINYEYVDFGGFHVRIADEQMVWRGFVGYFEDIVSRVEPRFSKVADDIYFVSWPTVGEAGDNVVWNLETMQVFAHLGSGEAFMMIHGDIHCRNTADCQAPAAEPMPPPVRAQKLAENVRALGFASPMVALKPTGAMGPADLAGMKELHGQSLSYETPEGLISLEFADEQILVSDAQAEGTPHSIHATRIAEGVYFVSWGGLFGGNHIVFNAERMTVYDHIGVDGTRAESIYAVSCFGPAGDCE